MIWIKVMRKQLGQATIQINLLNTFTVLKCAYNLSCLYPLQKYLKMYYFVRFRMEDETVTIRLKCCFQRREKLSDDKALATLPPWNVHLKSFFEFSGSLYSIIRLKWIFTGNFSRLWRIDFKLYFTSKLT